MNIYIYIVLTFAYILVMHKYKCYSNQIQKRKLGDLIISQLALFLQAASFFFFFFLRARLILRFM